MMTITKTKAVEIHTKRQIWCRISVGRCSSSIAKSFRCECLQGLARILLQTRIQGLSKGMLEEGAYRT